MSSLGPIAIVLVLGFVGLACGEDDGQPAGAATVITGEAVATTTAAAPAQPATVAAARTPRGITVTTRNSQFGRVLFDGRGRVFYLFTKEKSAKPQCYDACADAWPPVLAKGEPRARGGARQSLIGTTKRRGGARQVTYGGVPMYYYAHDGTGQILCHNVIEFGGTWLVVRPDGTPAPG